MAAATQFALAPKRGWATLLAPATRTLVACLLLSVVTLALYSQVSHNDFVNYDDDLYVLGNPHVRAGLHWSTVTWAFTSLEVANWHPLTWLSHALDCQLFRLNPTGHHYASLLLHIANVILLFLLLESLTGSSGSSLTVAALFAVHPLNVESVAWIAERKNVLAMLFFLLTLIAYARYVRRAGTARYVFVVALFALSLMAKPLAITLPFLLLLLDYWPLQRTMLRRGLYVEKLPLLVLSMASARITLLAQRAGGAVVSSDAHPFLLRIENAIFCYSLYVAKLFWPSRLAALYPYPTSLPAWRVLTSALFLLAVTAAVLKYRQRRYLSVGWFWYLGTMVPMIGFVQVGNQSMADRYAYLPAIGLFVMIVWGFADLAKQSHILPKYLAVPGVAVVLALALIARLQIAYWRDDSSLWSHALAVTRNNFVAENNFGTILARQGKYEDAVVHFRAASALEPADPVSQLNLGIYAQQHGDIKQSLIRYELVLRLTPDPRILSTAHANLGQIYFGLRDYPRARENYEAADRLNDPFPLPLGLIAQKTGDWNHAIDYYTQAVQAQPSDIGYLVLAQALKHNHREKEASQATQQAERISRNIQQAQRLLDDLLAQ